MDRIFAITRLERWAFTWIAHFLEGNMSRDFRAKKAKQVSGPVRISAVRYRLAQEHGIRTLVLPIENGPARKQSAVGILNKLEFATTLVLLGSLWLVVMHFLWPYVLGATVLIYSLGALVFFLGLTTYALFGSCQD